MPEIEPSKKEPKDWGLRGALSGGLVTVLISALDLDELKIPGTGLIASAASNLLAIVLNPTAITVMAFGAGFWAGVSWQNRKVARSSATKAALKRQEALARNQEYGFGGELIRAGEMLERYATKLPGKTLSVDAEAGLRSSNVSLQRRGIPSPDFEDMSDPQQFKTWSHFLINVGNLLQDHHLEEAVEFARQILANHYDGR